MARSFRIIWLTILALVAFGEGGIAAGEIDGKWTGIAKWTGCSVLTGARQEIHILVQGSQSTWYFRLPSPFVERNQVEFSANMDGNGNVDTIVKYKRYGLNRKIKYSGKFKGNEFFGEFKVTTSKCYGTLRLRKRTGVVPYFGTPGGIGGYRGRGIPRFQG